MPTHRSLALILPLLSAGAAAAGSSPGLRRSLARHHSSGGGGDGQSSSKPEVFCSREIIDSSDETDGVIFRTITSSAEIAALASRDATKIATGVVKLLAGPCSSYCSDDDATFDMNRVREMCGPTAYDCNINEYGSGSCWMAMDAEEEYEEDEAVEGTWEKEENNGSGSGGGSGSGNGNGNGNGSSSGSVEDEEGDSMAAGKVEWNEEAQEYEVEVEAGYDQGDAVVYDQETASVVAASEEDEEDQGGDVIVTVTEEETTAVTEQAEGETVTMVEKVSGSGEEAEEEGEEEEPPNCISCHYFDRVRWVEAGKAPRPESFYDKQTNNPDKPDECMGTGHWFGVIRGRTCEEVFASEQKYEICGQYPAGGRCEPTAEWSAVPQRGKVYGKCVYLCDNDGQSDGDAEDADQR